VLGEEVLVKRKMVNKLPRAVKIFPGKFSLLRFFERDQDITYYDEWHYIYITVKETIKIFINGNQL
jgi:hypothetical protein